MAAFQWLMQKLALNFWRKGWISTKCANEENLDNESEESNTGIENPVINILT